MNLQRFLTCYVFFIIYTKVRAIKREFYIGIVEEEWDFAPKGNLLHKDNKYSNLYLKNDPSVPLIGKKYMKAMYREFTDSTFTKMVEPPTYMGILGPFLHAEVGDDIVIHFHNMAKKFNYSMHPHGVFYHKNTEGALYYDHTFGKDKFDDAVPPGGYHKYVWIIHPNYGPTSDDPNCITWLVHSHQHAEEEIMDGSVLIAAVCRKGTLDETGKRKDVDKEFPLLFMIFDEGKTSYTEENEIKYLGKKVDGLSPNISFYQRGNKKHSINGYLYGNLQGLEACLGDRISLHIAVAGNDDDTHSVYVQGHTMTVYHHRLDTVGLFPGDSLTAMLTAENEGTWLVSTQNALYIQDGMQTLFTVNSSCSTSKKSLNKSKQVYTNFRRYYIKAEEEWWNYAPSGYNKVTGVRFEDEMLTKDSFGNSTEDLCKLNGRYKKAFFRGYTSSSFITRLQRPEDLGYLGPVIKAEVGDIVKVIFYNNATKNYSIQPYRFFVDYDESGIKYDGGPDVAVLPGKTKYYTWRIPVSVGPTANDPDCLFGRYFSAVDIVKDTYSGLTGPLLICRKGTLSLKGENMKVDKEFYLMFSAVREGDSHYFKESVLAACPNADYEKLSNDADYLDINIIRSLNGFLSGNLNGLLMCVNDKVVWYVTSVGSGMDDIHSPHFFGNTFTMDGKRKDSITLTSDIFHALQMIPDNRGIWALEDQVTLFELLTNQMVFLYEVKECWNIKYKSFPLKGKTRTYYIAAVEAEWNYAPLNLHPVTLKKLSEDPQSKMYYINDPDSNLIGHKFKKALYREFTDGTFTQEKIRTEKESHLGFMGPFIKAEVGDKVIVVFKNMASFNFSIVPHGLLYNKTNEGFIYKDGVPLNEKKGGHVAPGDTYTYEWYVPHRAGPGPDDFNCITWAYLSHAEYPRDIYSTLIGPLIVCKEGILDDNGKRLDVDRDYALLFYINNEGASAYLSENVEIYLNKTLTKEVKEDLLFIAANDKLSINGFIFGNVPKVTMFVGERIAWYILSLGETRSTHTVHWHGNTFVRRVSGLHTHDVMDALPGDFDTVEMEALNSGTWLMHCHVNNHSQFGMEMVYTVLDPIDSDTFHQSTES